MMVDLTCGGRNVVLTTQPGSSWQALRMGTARLGLSPDGRYVAVPGRSRTSIISPERGVVSLPLPVTGRCDMVVPDGPDGAVLLTAADGTTAGRRSSSTPQPTAGPHCPGRHLPTFGTTCATVESSAYDLPYRFDVSAPA